MHSPCTSLTQAIVSGDKNLVAGLLSTGSDVNCRNLSGQTPLIIAIVSGQTHLIRLLLDAGADSHLRDNVGLNAIDWSERKGLPEAKSLLLGKPNRIRKSDEVIQRSPAKDLNMSSSTSSQNESQSVPDANSSDEKARKWIAGLRARFEEKARQQEAGQVPSEKKVAVQQIAVPATTEEKAIRSNEVEVPEEKKASRKRCPKCNAVYDGELLAYCAHHIVPLVDIDAPAVTEPPKETTAWLWLILMVSASAIIVAGYYLIISRSKAVNTVPTVAASPTQPQTQRASAIASIELAGKANSLPDAECPLQANGEKATGTVVVRVKVNKDGRVYWSRSTGGDWLLRAASMDAATKATFSPERLKGNGVEGSLTYTFKP